MECDNNDLTHHKELSGRKRKKLYGKLRAQMEFYFSDSNLAKDKFLYNIIQNNADGYVDLEVFKSFNKIKALSEDINLIVTSLSRSEFLEVSDDKSKVRRKTPIEISKDFDACTLYVEGLPAHADHKWIKDVFDHFGTVEYINIPRFNISQKIKGFAFIEFSSPESVIKACQFYKNSSSVIKNKSEGEETDSVQGEKRKLEDSESVNPKRIKISSSSDHPKQKDEDDSKILENASENSNAEEISKSRKRKSKIMEVEKEERKKQKMSVETLSVDSLKSECEIECSGEENGEIKLQSEVNKPENSNPSKENVSELENSKEIKKKRKHSKKNRNRHERPTLRVMSKAEWKSYRNKYLDLQRVTMSYLKKHVLLESQDLREHDISSKFEPSTKKELKFQSGVILKIKLSKPIENLTDIKEQIKAYAVVAYIDAQLGNEDIFIRCHSAEDASSILQDKKFNPLGEVVLLSGKEEENYWEKIKSDREAKLNAPVIRKRRGRDKLIAKAAKLAEQKNKHIYFDEQ